MSAGPLYEQLTRRWHAKKHTVQQKNYRDEGTHKFKRYFQRDS
jgi:hypothetical protein